jgi:hypothetical protein
MFDVQEDVVPAKGMLGVLARRFRGDSSAWKRKNERVVRTAFHFGFLGGCSPMTKSILRKFSSPFRLRFNVSVVARPVGVIPTTKEKSSLHLK